MTTEKALGEFPQFSLRLQHHYRDLIRHPCRLHQHSLQYDFIQLDLAFMASQNPHPADLQIRTSWCQFSSTSAAKTLCLHLPVRYLPKLVTQQKYIELARKIGYLKAHGHFHFIPSCHRHQLHHYDYQYLHLQQNMTQFEQQPLHGPRFTSGRDHAETWWIQISSFGSTMVTDRESEVWILLGRVSAIQTLSGTIRELGEKEVGGERLSRKNIFSQTPDRGSKG
ncbi:hypothetical protein Acr_08g0013630 [Actinidia rufa]|uniref:Uncharacterized protein n=1 Tax=Actinidia rufa TaxID=165716 RepID=A0A7J0F4W0_9ERIC|nr:hypothetical protein Acr_08g0013630 [Actinidia rufa]